MEIDYSFIHEDEFDATNIELKKDYESWSSKKYPAKDHARRVAEELGVQDGIIYLPGAPEKNYEDSDQPPPLRQRRYFYYLSGANFHDCAVTYEIAQDRLILWVPYVEPRQVLWFGSTPSAARAMELFDVDEARYTNQLPKFFDVHFKGPTTLYVLHQDQAPRTLRASAKLDFGHLQTAMDRARVVKDAYEIAMIRRANDISSSAHRQVAKQLTSLANERELEAIFQAVCTAKGARSQAYPIIAGAGENASTLHYEENDQPLDGRELVVLDAGCEWKCYASDITRTLPISGSFSPRAAEIYRIVEEMQEDCISAVKPGVMFYKLHLHAAAVGLSGLIRLGILKGNPIEMADIGIVSAFFPHGLGHHVGLEVHDVSGDIPLMVLEQLGLDGKKRHMVSPTALTAMRQMDIAAAFCEAPDSSRAFSLRERQVLAPNHIVTIEPGLYFCRPYLEGYFLNNPKYSKYIDRDVLEGYYAVGGVRIEDDILVTADGYENLTAAPKGQELLEIMNHKKVVRK